MSSLIGSHTHMNRAFGMQRAGVLAWTRVQADPYDERIRDKAEEEIWVYPKNLYDRYRSATLHTASHKFKVPKRVWQGLSVAVALIGIRSPSCTVWPRAPLSRTPLAPA